MDNIQWYELKVLLESLEITYKQNWEQSRLIAYTTIQSQSSKSLKPTDVIKFSWDKEEKKDSLMTKADVERLSKKMNDIINKK